MSHRQIEVLAPTKTADSYTFSYWIARPVEGLASAAVRARAFLTDRVPLSVDRRKFGFVAANFAIDHSTFWDTVYPLLHLTRQGGPLFDRGCESARIVLRFPFDPQTADFFVGRASNLGIALEVDGVETARADERQPGDDNVLAFGGGKDSRLLLGLLREFGDSVQPYQAGSPIGVDIPGLRVVEPVSVGLADRVLPGLMASKKSFYFGSGLGEAHLSEPWHRHYDFGSPVALGQLGDFCSRYGSDVDYRAPLSVLPYNLIQKILAERFPRLAAFQHSVEPNERTEKNLHVSLCKLYHGLDIQDHASSATFRSLLNGFVRRQVDHPDDFGFRSCRLPIHLEMRALIDRLRDHSLVRPVSAKVPEHWRGDWIDYIHGYVNPDLEPEFFQVFREYADDLPEGEFRIPVGAESP